MTKIQYNVLIAFILSIKTVFFVSAQHPGGIDKIPDKQIEQYYSEALARGLTESEIEILAVSRGYTYGDILKVKERLAALRNIPEKSSESGAKDVPRQQTGTLSVKEDKGRTPATHVFGSGLFQSSRLSFEANMRIPTPSNYVLGPEDELNVDLSGYSSQQYTLKVSPEGTVKIENLPPVYVNGLTIEKAREKLRQRLATLFGGLRDGGLVLDVTLGKVRSISVTVVGEAMVPGTYVVSSLATLFNALNLSGGPNENGSFRSVKLLRNNREIQSSDLYDFLLKGSLAGNMGLQDQDVIFIPVAERKVSVEGAVRRGLTFELRPGELLSDLIRFAGGFSERAYTSSINIYRNTDKETRIVTVRPGQFEQYALENGDLVKVGEILNRYENRVRIEGAVFRPGEFALSDQLITLTQLIQMAEGLREDAFVNRALLYRLRENLEPEVMDINLGKLIKGESPDIPLRKEDLLIVRSVKELQEARTISVQGAVSKPGEYDFAENMKLNDLVFLAGGLREGASQVRVEIARRLYNDESADSTVEVLHTEIDKTLLKNGNPVMLMPFDQVFVRQLPNYRPQQKVMIEGEVNYPGSYAIENRKERVADLVTRAGGLKHSAFVAGARFYRGDKLVALDLAKTMADPGNSNNISLEENDRLVIPGVQETVRIRGQVMNESSIAFQSQFSLRDYVNQAGGFTDSAAVKKVYVNYANGMTDRTKSFLGFKTFPKAEKGMEIVVPVKHRHKMTRSEAISIGTGLMSVSVVLLSLIRLL